MADENNTAKAGAEPVNKEDAAKGQVPDSPTDKKDATADSSTEEKLPFDQHPKWKAARQAEKKLQELLKANDVDDPDELLELAKSGKTVKGKLSDLNQIDDIIEKAKRLDSYEVVWRQQEEERRRGAETPEQTIARLEKQLKGKEAADRHKEEKQKQQEAAKQALKNYDREVQSLVKEMELPKEQQAFAMEFMGVNNPFNEIDITDRKAINRMVADQKKKLESFKQSVIQDYIKGKETIPKVGATTAAPMGDKTKVYLKDARKALHEAMNRVTGG